MEWWMMGEGDGKSSLLVVFQCETPLTLLRVVTCGNASLIKVMTSQSMASGWSRQASCSVCPPKPMLKVSG
ncbi:hypothetical protein L3X38_034522 [Prunus dulcis]|uniref:Uncharacterized protein n=1 Tax=Prunus dulcis TaxID=3755 RepID=A0AAD4YYM5_PRUDU|nr:hypothetical protein L3X38_034522 [Prunus dulcis]